MTLTEVSYYSKKIAPYAIVILIFLTLLYFLIKSFAGYIESRKVLPLLTDPIFGKISKLEIKNKINYPINTSFSLDNIEGRPVTATGSAKVFYLPQKSARLGYLENIYLIAKNLGFDTELVKHNLQNTQAQFEDSEKKYTVDINNFNFQFKYNYEEMPELFTNTSLLSEKKIRESAKEFLRLVGRYPDELAKGKDNITYFKYDTDSKEFKAVENRLDANVVEVDFYRQDIDDLPMVSSKYFNSSNFVVMTLKTGENKVIKSQIKFFEKEDQRYGVYPIKTGEEAYEELKLGKGIIVTSGFNSNQIIIKKMFLGYFDPDYYQSYLQPIYVFLGENGFASYVQAIRDNYIE